MRIYSIIYILALTGIVGLQSCAVGPNFHRPEYETAEKFRFDSTQTDSVVNNRWWTLFNDSVLDTLIYTALSENKNVLIAASRIEQSRANVGYNKANYGPKVNVNGGATTGNMILGSQLTATSTNFNVYPSAAWELDFWGKYRRGTEAAKADLLSSFYGKRSVEIALIGEVSRSYFLLLDYQSRLQISMKTYDARDSSLHIIQMKYDKGVVPLIDVNQAEVQLSIAKAAIPFFKRQVAFSENNISVLLGKNPDSLMIGLSLFEQELPDSIPVGIPSDILERRPDVLQAEQLFRMQNANIGIAQAMRFPSISLTGSTGLGSSELTALVSGGLGWSAGLGLVGPIFHWGQNKRRVEMEREKTLQAVYQYENTILNALREVDNSLIKISTLKEELVAREERYIAANSARDLAILRYDQGVASYLEVLENERQSFDAELEYSKNYQELLNSYITLYSSLGGGWISEAEMNKARDLQAQEENTGVENISIDSLEYAGQVVDLDLTKEEKQARKDKAKEQQRQERERDKAVRQQDKAERKKK